MFISSEGENLFLGLKMGIPFPFSAFPEDV
jgi:hypothetical protein